MLADVVASTTATAARLLDSERVINEADTRAFLVDPMLEALGWRLSDPDHVRREHNVYGGACLDYALFIRDQPALFVEAKALGKNLDSPQFVSQVVNYGNNEGVQWCVLTDGIVWTVYHANAPVRMPEKLVARIDLREPSSTERIRGLERAALESGAIEGWAQRELAARPSATTPRAPSTSARVSFRPKRANLDTNERGADFDQRLAETDPAATLAARNLAEWARSRGWGVRTKGDTSRLFLPPQPTRGETGLRIHFESLEGEPAVEFDLATLRSNGCSTEADRILAALAELAGRRLTTKFPSLSCSVVLTRWDEVRENVLDPYASIRSELRT